MTTATKPETVWGASVSVDGAVKCSTGGKTQAEALTSILSDAVYYCHVYPRAKILIQDVCEQCPRCWGKKTVVVRFKRKRCPNCKGKPPAGRVPDFEFKLPESVALVERS